MVIVGAGRIGTAFAMRATDAGLPVHLVRRGEALPAEGPILVAVRTDDLEGLLASVDPARWADLVLFQNGALRDWLAARGAGAIGRAALYAWMRQVGDRGVVGGESPVYGRHAPAVAAWLTGIGVPARPVADFAAEELTKLIWLAANGPLCEAYRTTVGPIADEHGPELAALVAELVAVGRAAWNLETGDVLGRVLAYSRAIPDCPVSVKEWPWRNGWFVAQAARLGVPLPVHEALLARGAVRRGQTQGRSNGSGVTSG